MTDRKVLYAKLQTEYFSVGTGNLSTTLGDPQKHRGMEMTYTQYGLFVKYKGFEFVVPLANIVGCTLVPEDKSNG